MLTLSATKVGVTKTMFGSGGDQPLVPSLAEKLNQLTEQAVERDHIEHLEDAVKMERSVAESA